MKTNNLIAEFMGYVNTTPNDPDFNIYEHKDDERDMLETMSMKYHESWDWLMPVVEKIETTVWNITNSPQYKRAKERGRKIEPQQTGDIFVSYDERVKYRGWWCMTGTNGLPGVRIYNSSDDNDTKFKTKIEATYVAVVQFIEWYNEHK